MVQSQELHGIDQERVAGASSQGKYVVVAHLAAAAIFAVFAVWVLRFPDSLRHATREDGPIEYATGLLWGLSAVGFLLACGRSTFLKHRTEKWKCFFLVCFALLMIFFCGEEISWGQRLFDFGTPVPIAKLNRQNEFTLHNIGPLQFLQDRLLLLFIVAVAVLFPAVAAFARGRALIQRFAFPVLPVAYVGFFVLAYVYIRAFHRLDSGSDQSGEVRELMVSLGMFLFALHGAIRPDDLFRIRVNR
jgi:hypothetical protein